MQVVDAAVWVQGCEVPRQLVPLDARAPAADPAVKHRDVEAGHRPGRQIVDGGGEHSSPRQAEAHAIEQPAVHVVGGGPGHGPMAGRPGLAGDHYSLLETKRGRELEGQVTLKAARAVDLDVDDALVACLLQVPRHGRCVEAERARDLDLALAGHIEARGQVDEDVGGRPGGAGSHSRLVWRSRMSSIVWPVRSRSRIETMSKKTSWAAS